MDIKKYIVTLTEEERGILGELAYKGEHKAQKVLDALTLLGCDAGDFQEKRSTNEEISRVLNTSMIKIDRVKKRFVEEGLDVALSPTSAPLLWITHFFTFLMFKKSIG